MAFNDESMRPRRRWRGLTIVGVLAMWALLVFGATAAIAKPDSSTKPQARDKGVALLQTTPAELTGTAADGTAFTGQFKLKRFKQKKGVVYAVGRLTGALGSTAVHRTVALPVTGASNPEAVQSTHGRSFHQTVPTPGACQVLHLVLGPLDLNLLGLRVNLDTVDLLVEAIPGAGNLLGNLLCSVAGLLDPGSGLGGLLNPLLTAITNLLNGLLGGLGA